MKKNLKIVIISIIFTLGLVSSSISVQAINTSYVIYGQTFIGSNAQNDITVTAVNINTTEELTCITKTDEFANEGTYVINLGNMLTQWERGNIIEVSFTHGKKRTETFTIPDNGTIMKVDITIGISSGGSEKRGISESMGGAIVLPIAIAFIFIALILFFIFGYKNNTNNQKRKNKKPGISMWSKHIDKK